MFAPNILLGSIACAAIAFTSPAFAHDIDAPDGSVVVVDATLVVDDGQPTSPVVAEVRVGPFATLPAIPDGGLSCVAGMANVQQSIVANNSSTVSGNSVNGQSVTGVISIDGQAFQNLNGLSVLTANTGNNVSINASMNVNVSVQQ